MPIQLATMDACATLDAAPHVVTDRPAVPDVSRILGLRIPVSVILAERQMNLQSVLEITLGTIIEFDTPFDAELTLCVANGRIGRGVAVKAGENFGLRVTRIENIQGRIDALGKK